MRTEREREITRVQWEDLFYYRCGLFSTKITLPLRAKATDWAYTQL